MCFENITSVSNLLSKLDVLKNKYVRSKILSWDYFDLDKKPYAEFGYRGISNSLYKLRPRAINENLHRLYTDNFDSPIFCFQKEASSYLRNTCGNDLLLWMQYAQHYGVPTRLLDFSQNPLVALYFACQNTNVDGALWIINIDTYDYVTTLEYMDIHNLRRFGQDEHLKLVLDSESGEGIKPIYFNPDYIDIRMNAQASRFMLWPNRRFDLEDIINESDYMSFDINENQTCLKEFAMKLIIPKGQKKNILRDLDLIGVNEKNLFPGLDSIGKYVNYLYS